ncbi:sensor histidine kinase [Desulfatitalea alkaliphila]|uniref:histidine kinase n=1 Tax=Desulfatitalea alkaliphila TaxID=2929485 RepID=A0AA41R4G5_9BACT|nr:ATP-binding protein [Desulfatitalea alkaliphila]MCJ8502744.1 ATP-binding protein [Desulfatitalea alkaliphila]
MSFWQKIKPQFWDHRDVATGLHKHMFNFRRIWYLSVLLTTVVAVIPIFFLAAIDYQVTQKAIESEIILRTSRLVSNARRTLSFMILERQYALQFLVRDNAFALLRLPERLDRILISLQGSFGGFTDLGLIDRHGTQLAYSGPYELTNFDYSQQNWFAQALEQGTYISDVFMGYRQSPHLVIAVRHLNAAGEPFVLRATIEAEQFHGELVHIEAGSGGDMFIINQEGILQTPSQRFGAVFERMSLPVPDFSTSTRVFESLDARGQPLVIGYAYLNHTPFILMVAKPKSVLMHPWQKEHRQIFTYMVAGVLTILLVAVAVSTYLVAKIHTADQTRLAALHNVEYVNKMASIGRLAAGVAHEINNPLAIINEKAGLMQDLLQSRGNGPVMEKLAAQIASILNSVNRCATITRRLLSFARPGSVSLQPVQIGEVIENVIGFLGKEAEYRGIDIRVAMDPDIPAVPSDRGKLEQIFLNLMNNAFAAVEDGGHLRIEGSRTSRKRITIAVADDGCGIAPEDIKRVFEPFFSTRTQKGGTGLGLSITYGLVQELGGTITVESQVNQGTRFTITLPLEPEVDRDEIHTGTAGR